MTYSGIRTATNHFTCGYSHCEISFEFKSVVWNAIKVKSIPKELEWSVHDTNARRYVYDMSKTYKISNGSHKTDRWVRVKIQLARMSKTYASTTTFFSHLIIYQHTGHIHSDSIRNAELRPSQKFGKFQNQFSLHVTGITVTCNVIATISPKYKCSRREKGEKFAFVYEAGNWRFFQLSFFLVIYLRASYVIIYFNNNYRPQCQSTKKD